MDLTMPPGILLGMSANRHLKGSNLTNDAANFTHRRTRQRREVIENLRRSGRDKNGAAIDPVKLKMAELLEKSEASWNNHKRSNVTAKKYIQEVAGEPSDDNDISDKKLHAFVRNKLAMADLASKARKKADILAQLHRADPKVLKREKMQHLRNLEINKAKASLAKRKRRDVGQSNRKIRNRRGLDSSLVDRVVRGSDWEPYEFVDSPSEAKRVGKTFCIYSKNCCLICLSYYN